MPYAAPRVCSYAGCGVVVAKGGRCEKHRNKERREFDRRRGSAASRGYGARWRRASKEFLKRNPLCVRCQEDDIVEPATIVDHKVPHRGDQQLFWNKRNWQPLCKQHHDRKTATEDGGFGRRPGEGG